MLITVPPPSIANVVLARCRYAPDALWKVSGVSMEAASQMILEDLISPDILYSNVIHKRDEHTSLAAVR